MEKKYTNTQHVMAFSFVVFMVALTIPAKLALAYPAYAMNNVSGTAFDGLATVIGAAPAMSLFLLGFVSAMLFLSVIWDKFSFVKMASIGSARSRRSRGKWKKSGGFISLELASMSALALLMVFVLSSPAFV